MFENPRRGRQVSNFTTNVPKILDLKSSSEQIFFRKLSLGAPAAYDVYENDIDKIAIDAGGKDAILSITAEEKLRKLLNEREKSSLLYK